jgi:hypothetical protein
LVLQDIQTLSKSLKTLYFGFVDESIPVRTLSLLADGILSENFDIRWAAEVRFEKKFTPELCHDLYRAGCRMLAFGLESGCQRVLDFMNKGITIETASHVLGYTAEAGIWNHVFFFFGFPTETLKEAQETLQFIKNNRDVINSINYGVFRLDRNSEVYKNPQLYQIKVIENAEDELSLTSAYEVASGLSSNEVIEFYKENKADIQDLFPEQMFDFGWYRLLMDK